MNANPPTSKRKWLWPAINLFVLVAWTAYNHIGWMHRTGHLHGLPAFFFGVLVLLFVNMLGRLCMRTWKRGLRWLTTGEPWRLCGWALLFAVSTVALFYAVELWRGKRAWAGVVREADIRGEKLSLESIMPPPVSDEQNFAQSPFFAPLLAVSNGVSANSRARLPGESGQFEFVAHWEQWPFLMGRYESRPPSGYLKAAPWLDQEKTDLRAWMGFWRGWTNEPAFSPDGFRMSTVSRHVPEMGPPEAAALLLAGLRQPFGEMLEQLRAHSDRPSCRFPVDYTRQMFEGMAGDVRHVHVLHGFMRILRLRACAELALGENEPALRDVRLALRLADYVRQQPWATSTPLRLDVLTDTLQPVWEGLAERHWDEQQLAAVQMQLQRLDVLSDYPIAVRNDAVAMANFVERIIPTSPATSRALPVPPEDAGAISLIRLFYPAGWSLQDQAAIHRFHLETTSRYLDLTARRIVGRRHGEPCGLFTSSDPIFPIIMTPKVWQMFDDAAEGFLFAQTAVDLATLACALERYRLANSEFPPTLDALVPQFTAKLPRDIITGELLKYRRTDGGGFVLYSVGFNQTDEGGKPCIRYKNLHGQPEPRFDLDQNDWVWFCPATSSAK